MKLINYGHACFKVIDDDLSVVFDPYRDGSVPQLQLKNIEANYVFSSHDHYDHDGVNKVKIINTDKKLNIKEILLPHDANGGKQRGMSYARIIHFSDYSICHMGDIGDIDAVINCNELKNIDVVLCPINGYFTIGALNAIELQKKMNWKLLIPMHYFKKEDGSGYPDGNQIDIFKNHIDYLEVNDYIVELNEKHFAKPSLIFIKHQ